MFAQANPSIVVLVLLVLVMTLTTSLRAGIIPMDTKYAQSLDGTWRFKLEQALPDVNDRSKNWGTRQPIRTPETFEPFYALDYQEDASWHDLAVPGNWEMAGYSPATYNEPDDASAFYRKTFVVPAEWTGRRVMVNFDAVQNATEVWLNGQPVNVSEPSWGRANYHESGWTAWQADLTPHVKFGGKNLLALRVTKNTKSANLDSGDYYFLGGIHRTVTLFSVPQTHIGDLSVRTKLLSGGKGDVQVSVSSVGAAGLMVRAKLGDEPVVKAPVGADGMTDLQIGVAKPKLWSAEHPNLYPLTVELLDLSGKTIETITRRVGIREVSIKNGVFMVNGVPVKLAGMCRHDVYLSKGTAVGESVWRKDLELMRNANINTVRTSHYPYGTGFYDLCDEMGFYVIDELPYCWCETDNPDLGPAFLQRARETIARDKNHPCVIIWGIGNENRRGRNLQPVADLVKQLDPTRPRLVSCIPADVYNVEMDDEHYTPPPGMVKDAQDTARRAKWPMMYTETPNVWDIRLAADYGCLDIWHEVITRTWDVAVREDTIPGICIWEWQDRAVADKCPTKLYEFDPETGVNYFKVKGLVDGWRHPRPDYYHVKMAYSPIRVDEVDFTAKPGYVVLNITNRYAFTNLSEINTNWKLLQKGKTIWPGTASLKLAPRTSGKVEIKLPEDWQAMQPDALRVDFDHPGGWNVVSHQSLLALPETPAVSRTLPDGLRFPALNLVTHVTANDSGKWRSITRHRGSLINAKTEPASAGSLKDVRSLDADIVLDKDPSAIIGHVHAEYSNGRFSYKLDWTGEKANIQELGWIFEMPKAFDRFSWDRNAVWSYYPDDHIGRPRGTALPDSADVRPTNITRPDAYDFNSTKYQCNWASLTDAKGNGLMVEFTDQRHHCRGGFGKNGAHQLVVNKQCSPPDDLSTPVVRDLYLELKPGDSISGRFSVGSR